MQRRDRCMDYNVQISRHDSQATMKHLAYRIEDLKRQVCFHGSIDVLAPHLATLAGRHIAIVSSRNEFVSDVSVWAEAGTFQLFQRSSLAELLDAGEAVVPHAAVVDMRPGVDIAPLLDALLEFRKIRPEVIVVLVSEEVKQHDFGTDRLRVCDVTIKGPVDAAILSLGVSEALLNNAKWRAKITEGKVDKQAETAVPSEAVST